MASTTMSLEQKREFIKQMTTDAWNAYVRYAWPSDMLRPITENGYGEWFGMNSGETIVAGLSTFWVMDLRREYEQAKGWIESDLDLCAIDKSVNVYQVISEYLGGLLSCHAQTDEAMFLEKALILARKLEPAYQTPTGVPYETINFTTGQVSGTQPYLSFLGCGWLEYAYLSQATGDKTFGQRVDKIRKCLKSVDKPKGLYRERIDCQTGHWCSPSTSLFGAGRDFYSSLIKCYIQTVDHDLLSTYSEAIDSVISAGLITHSSRSNLIYARNYDHVTEQYGDFMNQTGCYLGATLALGAVNLCMTPKKSKSYLGELVYGKDQQGGPRSRAMYKVYQHWTMAKQFTETCHQASVRCITGLPPRNFFFDPWDEATNNRVEFRHYLQRPEIVESYFVLYRLTHDERYREYAWQLTLSIHRHCRTQHGAFVDLTNVTVNPPERGNFQYADFLGATLKYLYLIFCEDTVLPLDKWTFNPCGHPLPRLSNKVK